MNESTSPITEADTILRLLDATVTRARRERAAWEAAHPSIDVDDRRLAVANFPLQRQSRVVA